MISFSVQHVLLMRLLIQFEIRNPGALHNLLFLAEAESLKRHDLGFYDFARTKTGVFSRSVHIILEEMIRNKYLERKSFKLTEHGRETYYLLATALRPFEEYADRCFTVMRRYKEDAAGMNRALKTNVLYRKAKVGEKIFKN